MKYAILSVAFLMLFTQIGLCAEAITTSSDIERALNRPVSRGIGVQMKPKVDLSVPFEINSATLKQSAFRQLEEVRIALDQPGLKDFRIQVAGHTDASGSASYNQKLSQRRANSVKDYLVENGIDPRRLDAIGLGESKLLLPESPNHAKNRRVELSKLGTFTSD